MLSWEHVVVFSYVSRTFSLPFIKHSSIWDSVLAHWICGKTKLRSYLQERFQHKEIQRHDILCAYIVRCILCSLLIISYGYYATFSICNLKSSGFVLITVLWKCTHGQIVLSKLLPYGCLRSTCLSEGWQQAYLSVVCVDLVQAKGEQSILGPNINPPMALVQQHGLGLKRCGPMSRKHPGPVQLPKLCGKQRTHKEIKTKQHINRGLQLISNFR